MFETRKALKQRIKELEKTCQDLELSIDFKNDIIDDLNKEKEVLKSSQQNTSN